MKQRVEHRAVVTIQAADITRRISPLPPNPKVLVLVMVPKGKHNVTVSTNCSTDITRGTSRPIWDQTFSIPVSPDSDVLVFQLFDSKISSQVTARSILPNRFSAQPYRHTHEISEPHLTADVSADQSATMLSMDRADGENCAETKNEVPAHSLAPRKDDHDREATAVDWNRNDGTILGACMFPVSLLPTSGDVITRVLQVFVTAELNSPSAGTLYIAAKLEKTLVNVLEKKDLNADNIGQYHRSRLRLFQDRFLSIGELAAFLHEEAYSKDIDANWDRAVTILAEQLAYRIYEITDSTDDSANFAIAKARVIEDGGLWDGM